MHKIKVYIGIARAVYYDPSTLILDEAANGQRSVA
jgi:ABC-type Na+ transport system ATPase subunit NatA